jgi:hypothetical protein
MISKRKPIRLVTCFLAVSLLAARLSPAMAAAPAAADDSLASHMKAAWQALASRQVAEAKTEIAAAAKQAKEGDEKSEVARMQLLATCVERFWAAIDAELKRLVAGDELKVDGTMASVVQSDPKGITLHVEGKNQRQSREKLPAAWARAIAEHRFDDSAANKLLMGAFLSVEPEGDRRAARKLWETAQRREPAAGELLPLLSSAYISNQVAKAGKGKKQASSDDDSAPPAAKVDVPDKDDLAAAAKRFKESYAADVKGAKTPEQKLELSRKLVEAADSADGEAWRWTLLHEGLLLAAATADPEEIEKVVKRLDERFKIDLWEINAEAFTKAAGSAKADAIAEVVRRSLQLLGDWEGQSSAVKRSHAKAAQKLDQAALAAARKAHDNDLVNSVIDRKKSTREN